MNKLGFHCQSFGDHLDWIIKSRVPAIKVMENSQAPLERYKAEVGGLVVGRAHYSALGLPSEPDFSDPHSQAQQWADGLSSYFDQVQRFLDCLVTCNEVGQDGDIISRHAEFEVRCCEILHGRGYRVTIGSFSVGNPPGDATVMRDNWRRFLPALQVADALSLHEYSAPRMWTDEGWRCLRYRRVRAIVGELGGRLPPIIIGECGIDWGVFPGDEYSRKGWRGGDSILPIPPVEYVRDLEWYSQQLQADPYILAAFIFNIGKPDWWSFDIGGVTEIEDYIRTSTTRPVIWPTGDAISPAPAPAPAPNSNPRVSPDGRYIIGDGLWFLLTNHNLGNVRWDRSGWDHGVIEKVETDTGYIMWAFKENGWQQYVYHIPTNTMRRRSGNHLVTL